MKQLLILGLSGFMLAGSGRKPAPPQDGPVPKLLTADAAATHWVDSVFESLNNDERIAQLIMIRAHSNLGADHVKKIVRDIKDMRFLLPRV